ncbi:MAG: alanine--tRNA ligase [Desulfomonilia bacterium]|jgi:alanyl-tRNA synthetase|uniref:Alanine--tRNA ligase n=1 Tax=anaerobic digester metagenome TaxID=1263854 RepID=A0A485M865_9ZZZZ|nr:alanine--tRNA ligase [Pseudomonadota bacterium]HON39150.1 alanine--tRNA ligase [Deltaproteobacteria bacterium]HRS57006.1 alanine--tRNA ligase [Desulfomonilia bacterium]HPD20299.1 alanine--tRNA ligase [Deltaproteobacteria bacterium]HPX17685.1 alanine--tRNA ligase [Deltaproteobacteria bacterium]
MKGSEIRSLFLKYFQEKGHTIVPSSSLVPADDPSLLFTNAGMVQFKSVFLGTDKRPYSRAATSQKCVRAGGKHNDLENVGRTARHHTFFEMLGNFSFGDYFKQGAIEFAWELLVKRMEIDPDKLWATVHTSDDEAFAIWRDVIGLSPDRIIRLGDKDNFWSMGDTGPCGPCSEIIFDQGPAVGCGRPECRIGECECDRYLEIWNLVFMQYNRDASGDMTPLPNPSIDTGMGLERVTAVMQGVKSNYDTDLFTPLISFITQLSKVRYGENEDTDVSLRVVADHARAGAFLVGDGVLPSNEGRGYVLRRILRRAIRHGKLLGMDKPFLHKVAMEVVALMSDAYPDLKTRKGFIDKVIANEEERFLKTLDRGLALLDEVMAEVKSQGKNVIPGDAAFTLYDTFGFPMDLTEDIARKEGLTVDSVGFEKQMEIQREKARTASAFTGAAGEGGGLDASLGDARIRFVGYDVFEAVGKILELQEETPEGYVSCPELLEGKRGRIITDITPFYGESGGQVGDTGTIRSDGASARVVDTSKTESGIIIHQAEVTGGVFVKGQEVTLAVDQNRRKSIMRHHSATHLLQRALREVLGEHVHQSGSYVDENRLRFDFTHFAAMSREEIDQVEAIVNQYVLEDFPIRTEITSKEQAMAKGAMALFDEKYGEEVRMVVMGDGVSVELCGGTHCHATGQIGLVRITSESSVSAGLRRIEAIAGTRSLEHLRGLAAIVSAASERLKCSPPEINERIAGLQGKIREQESTIKDLNVRIATGAGAGEDEKEYQVGAHKVFFKKVDTGDIAQMREVGDRIKERIKSGAAVLYAPGTDKATFMVMTTPDAVDTFDAGKIMKKAMQAVGGRGGGKPAFAQGGADAGSLEKVVKIFEETMGVTQ